MFVYDAGGKLVAEYSSLTPQTTATTRYLTSDHLGSPRIITDQNGAVLSRRDFAPFGEELYTGTGNRQTGHGYTYGDSTRQKFATYQRDEETDLDFAQARYHSSSVGRFTSPDKPFMDQWTTQPQSWNLYVYVRNNPLRLVDPSGMLAEGGCPEGKKCELDDDGKEFYIDDNDQMVYVDDPPIIIETSVKGTGNNQPLTSNLLSHYPDGPGGAGGMGGGTGVGLVEAFKTAGRQILNWAGRKLGFGASVVAAAPTGLNALNQLLSKATRVQAPGNWTQMVMKGDPQKIFDAIAKGGQRLPSGAVKLADGTIVKLYQSTTPGPYQGPTISINVSKAITKVRVTQ